MLIIAAYSSDRVFLILERLKNTTHRTISMQSVALIIVRGGVGGMVSSLF